MAWSTIGIDYLTHKFQAPITSISPAFTFLSHVCVYYVRDPRTPSVAKWNEVPVDALAVPP
jgi:hypothetical protein